MKKVMLQFLSDYKTNAEERTYIYYEAGSGIKRYLGAQTNDAPTKCLVDLAMEDKTFDRDLQILCICTEKVLEEKADGETAFEHHKSMIEQYLREQQNCPPVPVTPIRYYAKKSLDERTVDVYNQITNFLLAGQIDDDIRVYVDYTGGFRDASFLMVTLISYLESFSHVKCEKIVYSNFHEGKIESIDNIYSIYQMISGVNEFLSTGNARLLNDFFKCNETNTSQIIKDIVNFSNLMSICDLDGLDRAVRRLYQDINDYRPMDNPSIYDAIFNSLIPLIKDRMHISELYHDNNARSIEKKDINYPALIKWCIENGMIQQAATLYVEKMPVYYFANDDNHFLNSKINWGNVNLASGASSKEMTAFYVNLFDPYAKSSFQEEEEILQDAIMQEWKAAFEKRPMRYGYLQTEIHRIANRLKKSMPGSGEYFDRFQEIIRKNFRNGNRNEFDSLQIEGLNLNQTTIEKFMNEFGNNLKISHYCLTGEVSASKNNTANTYEKKVKTLKRLEQKERCADEDLLLKRMKYYLAAKFIRNHINHANVNAKSEDENCARDYLADEGILANYDYDNIKKVLLDGIRLEEHT